MIFYDRRQKRKLYFRLVSGFLLFSFLILSVHLMWTLSRVSTTEGDFDRPENRIKGKKISLSFDDGPHPSNTGKIMDVLEKHNVPATFFFIGENVLKYPEAAKEVYERGFEIGNHTFTHSTDVHKSLQRIKWELRSTNMIIRDTIGCSALLYRPPYLLDIGDTLIYERDDKNQILDYAKEQGFIPVGINIDSKDWATDNPETVIANLDNYSTEGIVLLHDGDGMGHTLESLEEIIRRYRSQGYEFVTVSQFLGLSPDKVMPVREKNVKEVPNIIMIGFLSTWIKFFGPIVKIIVVLTLARLAFIFLMYLLPAKKKKNFKRYTKPVDVIVPAYNEEDNIGSTIQSILDSSHPISRVIVVDDGSTDNTAAIVAKIAARTRNKVKLVKQANQGKAGALNNGILHCRSEVFVAMDGDTVFEKYAIGNLVKNFRNREIGAAAGKIKAVRSLKVLPTLQSIEYTLGQNMEKRAFTRINAVNVIPGPIGAWRKQDVISAGGYSTDTLVEDQDLTLAVLNAGKKVVYEEDAIAYTETPESLSGFVKQRSRWLFGTIQCFWKYKRSFLHLKKRNIGLIILPNILFFNIILPLISPIMDLVAIASLATGNFLSVLTAYNLFTGFDLAYALLGFRKEKKEILLFAAIPLQRIFYRQVLYFVLIKSLIKAIEGSMAAWNKLERQGLASRFYQESRKKI